MIGRIHNSMFWILLFVYFVWCVHTSPTPTNRNGDLSSSLPADFPLHSLKVNGSSMTCSQAFVLPAVRTVHLTNDQMRQLMGNKGGNYLYDYMAATQEEALENFPNMLIVTDPAQDVFTGLPMSNYHNYIAKNVLMKDLERLKFFLLNTTNEIGQPNMGVYYVNHTHNDKDAVNGTTTSTQTGFGITSSAGNGHQPTPNPTETGLGITSSAGSDHEPTPNPAQTGLGITSKPGNDHQPTPNPTHVDGTYSTIHSNITVTKKPENLHVLTTTNRSKPATLSNSSDPTPTSVTPTTLRSATTTVSSPVSPTTPGLQDTNSAATSTNDPLLSLSSSTLDPDVQKSLVELNKYLNGNTGLTQSDWNTAGLADVKTTVDPNTLLRLANQIGRTKRNTDGSTTHEQYCQLKGSLTDDRQYVHTCSSCAATTELSEDFFPRYINEVVCKTGDTDCFKIGDTVHGRCKQRYFTLNMLRKSKHRCMMVLHNGESLVMEDWDLVPKSLRVSCECTINKLSFLKPYVAQDALTVG